MTRAGRAEVIWVAPALAALAVMMLWATDQGGYFPDTWYPGALLLLALLAVAVAADGASLRGLSRAALVAIGALALYTAWCYASIAWADAPAPAWDAANQTLLYLVVFVLFSRRVVSARAAGFVIGAWVLAITWLAVIVLLELPGVVGPEPGRFSSGLEQPFGYSNANAAAWLMAAWPALTLAASREVPAWLRGVFAGAIVVLADVAVLSDSRGAFVATGIVLVVLLAAVPGRVRTVLTLLPAAAAVGVTAPYLLDLAQAAEADRAAIADLGDAAAPALAAALVAGVVVALAALVEQRRSVDEQTARDARRLIGVIAVGLAIGAAGVALVAAGDPVEQVRDGWREFKDTGSPRGSPTYDTAGFGGARYDYYRVALDLFREHPVNGIGAGNFAEDYLARGKVGERPTSPHSLELRALVQGGLVGAALLTLALVAAFVAGFRGLASGPWARAVGAGGVCAALYWVVDGSVDWFWELPALAAPAFALLALAGALRSRPLADAAPFPPGDATPSSPRLAVLAAAVAGVAAAASLALPYLADRDVRRAGELAVSDPAEAQRRLDRAADRNPLSAEPHLALGRLAIARGRLGDARRAFEAALDDEPRNLYATRALGAIASRQGRREEGLRLLRRALRLAPADPPTVWAVEQARRGRVDLAALEKQITDLGGQLVQ